jgi:hypothetical protein
MNLPMMSQQDKAVIKQRLLDLDREARKLKLIDESLSQGEYHIATVTLDNGEKRKFKVTYDEGYTDTIKNFYAKQGRKVVDIDMDFAVHGDNTGDRPEDSYNHMYNRGISEAQKKFPKASQEVIHEWATKWAKAHGGQLNENKHEYVLYIDNKPAAKYQQENDALRDIAQLKKSRPESVLDLKREVCNLETIKHIAEGQSIFNENQFDHLTSKRLKSILLAPQANAQTLEWAMDFTQDALRADYDDEGIDSNTFDPRNKAYEQAREAFYDQDGEINPEADLDATLAHLKQFWSV